MSRIASPLMTGLDLSPQERARLIQESRGPMALGVLFTFYGLSVVFVTARMLVRWKISKHISLDDWIVAASEAISTAMMVFIYFQILYGDGRHLLALSMRDADNIAKMNFGAVTLWCFAVTGAKVSILLQYLRLFQHRKATRLIWVLMVIVVLGGLSTLVVVMTACIPISAVWDTKLRSRSKCLNQRLFWQIQSAFEAVTCWAILTLLIPTMWKLQMSRSKRIGIIALLGLSSSSCISSVLRMKSAFDAIPESANEVHDFTWTGIMATVYATTELNTGIICCSLPALMPLRFSLFPCWFRRTPSPLVLGREHLLVVVADRKMPVARPILPTPSVTEATLFQATQGVSIQQEVETSGGEYSSATASLPAPSSISRKLPTTATHSGLEPTSEGEEA